MGHDEQAFAYGRTFGHLDTYPFWHNGPILEVCEMWSHFIIKDRCLNLNVLPRAKAWPSGLRIRKDIEDIWTPVLYGKMTRRSNLNVGSFCHKGQVSECLKCPSGCGGLAPGLRVRKDIEDI